jgi:quercetin dioxygenase-like cupin family protein
VHTDQAHPSASDSVSETIISARGLPGMPIVDGVELGMFASQEIGATGFSTGIATFRPGARMPYHFHGFSEAVTVLEGLAHVILEGRSYRVSPLDCVHVPAGLAHQVENDGASDLVTLSAFASSNPTRSQADRTFDLETRNSKEPASDDPEIIIRFNSAEKYELAENALFCDLFASRFGARGICGGHGRFLPGASLPCHTHDFDESITIVKGTAACMVRGKRYELSGRDTAFIPKGIPHRFLNESNNEMAMIWVYAGNEPDRRVVDSRYCSGELAWPGVEMKAS